MKLKIISALCVCTVLSFLCISFLPREKSSADNQKIYSNTLRLHILANSDTYTDQKLKLMVRDRITEVTKNLFADCDTIEKAKDKAKDNLLYIKSEAHNIIKQNGFDYDVDISLSRELYPNRRYGNLIFPAGQYNSLRIKIGNAQGKNWWCVLFPPLCTDAATQYDVSAEDLQLIQNNYGKNAIYILASHNQAQKITVKFKIVEILEQMGIV